MYPDISILALVAALLPLVLVLMSTNPFRRKNQSLPPSPPKLPFIGNAQRLGPMQHRSLHSLAQRYGPLMSMQMGGVQTMVVSSADVAQEIMKTYDHIFASKPPIKAGSILYKGIAVGFANGEQWRQARKLCVTHLLGPRAVQSFQRIREEEVASLLADVSASSSLGAVDLRPLLISFTSSIICRAVLGALSTEGLRRIFCELTWEDSRLLQKFNVYFPFLGWLDELSGLSACTRRHAVRWNALIDELINAHANMPKDGHGCANTIPSFLGVLLSLQKDGGFDISIETDLIKALVHEMIFGGIDKSRVALEWCMAELVRTPEAMLRLKGEVGEAAGGEEWVGEERLPQMPYLKAVIKETFRLHPPDPLLPPRQATQSCRVQGYDIPAGSRVIINAWHIGMDPQVWEMPEQFRPERFLDRATDFRGLHFELVPFGSGRRICPAIPYTVVNIELALANLVHRFDWQLPDGMKGEDLSMEEVPGITIQMKERLRLVATKATY